MKLRLASLLLGLLACVLPAKAQGQDAQARFEKSLKQAKSLAAVEIEFLDTLWTPPGSSTNESAFSRTFEYSYLASGPKYRAACKLISGTSTNLAKLSKSTFNGESYSGYDDDIRYMIQRTNSPPGDRGHSPLNPLFAPFMFLTRHSDECLQCVPRFTDIVSSTFANGIVLPKGQLSDGLLEISLPGLRLRQQPTTWKIALEQDGDSFAPKTIRRVAPGAKAAIVYRLLNYTNLGGYHFPTTIEWASHSYPGTTSSTLLSTGMVMVTSARIPEQIADSVFTLDNEEQSAAVIWNANQHKLIKGAPELAKVQARTSSVKRILLLMALITFPIIVALASKKFGFNKK